MNGIRSRKAISLIFLFCSFIGWLIFREIISTVWVISKISQPFNWIIPPSDIMAAVLAFVLFIVLIRNTRVNAFTNEAIAELSEVIWPKRKETVVSTGVVSVLVGISSLLLFAFDMIWGFFVRLFYK